jgi:hypothetical protein
MGLYGVGRKCLIGSAWLRPSSFKLLTLSQGVTKTP